ncbi:hypothetical protein I546_5818 [Mycobacterium kansasii 732]|nr:hypothetical protein I546_5818 [Mycobacterium kansasii 732]
MAESILAAGNGPHPSSSFRSNRSTRYHATTAAGSGVSRAAGRRPPLHRPADRELRSSYLRPLFVTGQPRG